MIIEIEERKIKTLYNDLQIYASITESCNIDSDSKKEYIILFNVTFTKATGDLVIEVPAIPG